MNHLLYKGHNITHKQTPILGVDFQREAAPPPLEDLKVEAQEEDVQIIDQGVSDAFAVS